MVLPPFSEQSRVIQLGGDLVGAHHQDKGNNGFEQADGGTVGVHALGQTVAVGVGVQHVGIVQNGVVAHQQLLLEAGGEDAADGQDQQDGDRGPDRGQGDMPDALDPAGAVDGRRFVKLLVDTGNGRQIDDRVISHTLPGIGDGNNPPEIGAVLEEQDAFVRQSQPQQQVVHNAAAAQEGQEDVRRDNPGDEVGQIGRGLDEFLHADAFQFVEHDGQDDRRRKGEQQGQQAGCQRVPHDHAEIFGEEVFKPLEADELRVKKVVEIAVLGRPVVGEGHVKAGHGRVADEDDPDDAGNHQQEQIFLIQQPGFQGFPVPGVNGGIRHRNLSFAKRQQDR